MVWHIGSRGRTIITRMAALRPFPATWDPFQWSNLSGIASFTVCPSRSWPGLVTDKPAKVYHPRESPFPRLGASSSTLGLAKHPPSTPAQDIWNSDSGMDLFDQMKQRFLSFKKHKFLEERGHFQTLAELQSPKFMVIACADSRVCPSNILGFQPGEAFMIRNVANLVPPAEKGPTETNAALEFAVNTLEVEVIFVIGHSNCAGIQTLMNMKDDESSSFVEKWVANAKTAKLRIKAEGIDTSFDKQCRLCEKESINRSLLNLLTYPWVEDKVRRRLLSINGGYYDFLNCTFEKWTLDFNERGIDQGSGSFSVKDGELWC